MTSGSGGNVGNGGQSNSVQLAWYKLDSRNPAFGSASKTLTVSSRPRAPWLAVTMGRVSLSSVEQLLDTWTTAAPAFRGWSVEGDASYVYCWRVTGMLLSIEMPPVKVSSSE